jgi:hypothetical protein
VWMSVCMSVFLTCETENGNPESHTPAHQFLSHKHTSKADLHLGCLVCHGEPRGVTHTHTHTNTGSKEWSRVLSHISIMSFSFQSVSTQRCIKDCCIRLCIVWEILTIYYCSSLQLHTTDNQVTMVIPMASLSSASI